MKHPCDCGPGACMLMTGAFDHLKPDVKAKVERQMLNEVCGKDAFCNMLAKLMAAIDSLPPRKFRDLYEGQWIDEEEEPRHRTRAKPPENFGPNTRINAPPLSRARKGRGV